MTLLSELPSWVDSYGEPQFESKLLHALQLISRYDLLTIRNAVEKHIARLHRQEQYDVTEMGKLFTLNRYLFDVPRKGSLGGPFFGGWDVPIETDSFNYLWPFELIGGRIRLIGHFRAYLGAEYLALNEFDHFSCRFGRANKATREVWQLPNKKW